MPSLPAGLACRVRVEPTARALELVGGEQVARADLTASEQSRNARLRRPADRADHLAAHALALHLARALATDLGEPTDGRLAQDCPDCGGTDHGVPRLHGAPRVHVSLAHARGWVAAAAADVPCGVDVETMDGAPVEPVPDVLAPAESAWLARRPAATRSADFLRLWTRKEALVKAGVTTLEGLASTAVHEPPAWAGAGVHLVDLAPAGAAVAALALRTSRG